MALRVHRFMGQQEKATGTALVAFSIHHSVRSSEKRIPGIARHITEDKMHQRRQGLQAANLSSLWGEYSPSPELALWIDVYGREPSVSGRGRGWLSGHPE